MIRTTAVKGVIGALVTLILIGTSAQPSAANAFKQSWGPDGSYIAQDVYGSKLWVDRVHTFNFSYPSGAATICKYQFKITYTLKSGAPKSQTSAYKSGCVNGYLGAWAKFSVKANLKHNSLVCTKLRRSGTWYDGPCARIKG